MASIVAFHAHPDDEVLLGGGTLAMLAAAGHRVVVALATDGSRGLADPGAVGATEGGLGARRLAESARACAVLGLEAPIWIGYADSGEVGPPGPGAFVAAPVDAAAARLADLLRERGADLLLVDDEAGGYGHRDHRRAHQVGVAAAALAGTPLVLAVTVDRTTLGRVAAVCRHLPGLPASFGADRLGAGYTARADITHRIDVRAHCGAKRAAMRAHTSQTGGGTETRTLALFGALPMPLFRLALGREWFAQQGSARAGSVRTRLPLPDTPSRAR